MIKMHGSFDVEAVKKFYGFYDNLSIGDFSQAKGNLYDFSSAGMPDKVTMTAPPKKKKSIAEKHDMAKRALDDANTKMLEEYSEDNLKRLALAQQFHELTLKQFEKEQAEKKAALQYAEFIGPEDVI